MYFITHISYINVQNFKTILFYKYKLIFRDFILAKFPIILLKLIVLTV